MSARMLSFFRRPLDFLPHDKGAETLLPWVIAVMVFLSTLSAVLAVSISSGLTQWQRGLTGKLTVQITAAEPARQRTETQAAIKLLRATPGVAQADILAERDMLALIAPYLGDFPIQSGITLPTLIDVTLSGRPPVLTAALNERLQATAPSARLDDHKAWVGRLLSLAGVVELLLIAVAATVALSGVALVVFGCRAGLASQRDTIEIMHLMGAEDSMIAHAFDWRYFWHGLAGGTVGAALAALALLLLSELAADLGGGLVASLSPAPSLLTGLVTVPPLAAAMAMLTARLTVMRALALLV